MEYWLVQNPWMGMIIWSLLYLGDYYSTLNAATLYTKHIRDHFEMEGSYELNPQFQEDIDNRRSISPKFIAFFALSNVFIISVWFFFHMLLGIDEGFLFTLGSFLLAEIAVYFRHIRNTVVLRTLAQQTELAGKFKQPRWVTLQASSAEFFSFAGLFVMAAILTWSWFFLGGSLACCSLGVRHLCTSRKLRRQP